MVTNRLEYTRKVDTAKERGRTMKKRYDVARLATPGGISFRGQREAYNLAKAMARYYGEEIVLRELTWDGTVNISTRTALVSESGYRYI